MIRQLPDPARSASAAAVPSDSQPLHYDADLKFMLRSISYMCMVFTSSCMMHAIWMTSGFKREFDESTDLNDRLSRRRKLGDSHWSTAATCTSCGTSHGHAAIYVLAYGGG